MFQKYLWLIVTVTWHAGLVWSSVCFDAAGSNSVDEEGKCDSHVPTLSLTAVEVLLEDELEVLMVHGL